MEAQAPAAPRPRRPLSRFPRHVGWIRRFTASPAVSPPPPSSAAAPPAKVRDRTFAKRLFHALIARRRLRHALSRTIAVFYGRPGAAILSLVQILLSHRLTRPLGRILLAALRWWLIAATPLHLAAHAPISAWRNARILNLLFRSDIVARRGTAAIAFFLGLFEAGQIERMVAEIKIDETFADPFVARLAAQALLQAQRPAAARRVLERMVALQPDSALGHRLLGRSFVAEGRYAAAQPALLRAVALEPSSVMAYQNSAGRYDVASYRPQPWELSEAGTLVVADVLARHAEELTLCGALGDSIGFYRRRIDYQKVIAAGVELPAAIETRLAALCPQFDRRLPSRILPYEWVTQIGHLGMLDVYAKMAVLGMLPPANHILLAPVAKVANPAYLAYAGDGFCVARDPDLVDAIFPYQRYFGDSFMAIETLDGGIEPWTLAAARAQCAWDALSRPPRLRLKSDDRQFGEDVLRRLGVPPRAWYVGLHVRESGFYGEAEESMGSHRNARIGDYGLAVAEILRRGGYVIRLGDPSMTPYPARDRVVDYAHAAQRSPRMDVFLMATCRMFIGTTSGLTTALQAFGTPMLLANCVSNDWQFWPKETRFMTKRIWDQIGKRYLSLSETVRPPVQGDLGNRLRMNRHHYSVEDNTAAEIGDAVAEMLDRLEGKPAPADSDQLYAAYREAIAVNPLIFGAALPAASFLRQHAQELCAK